MANAYKNKIIIGSQTLIDLTSDTALASDVALNKTFHLKSGEPVTGTFDNSLRTVQIPTVTVGEYTYNGSRQGPTIGAYDSNDIKITDASAINAGEHVLTLMLANRNLKWSDDTFENKTFPYTIEKLPGTIITSIDSVMLSEIGATEDVTIVGSDMLVVTSSNPTVATVEHVSGDTYRITAIAAGGCSINVSLHEDSNYTATKTILVASLADPVLNNNSWEKISAMSAAGIADTLWSVGDCKQITLNGTAGSLSLSNYNTYVYILGFNHNSAVQGNGVTFGGFKTALTGGTDVCLCDSGYNSSKTSDTWFNMNNTNLNGGGWKSSHMRYYALGSTDILGGDASATTATNPVSNTLMSTLPSDLRAVMKPITKYTDNTGGESSTASNVTATTDYLPLLAEKEVSGSIREANTAEGNYQTQYTYYANNNSRIKYRHNVTSTSVYWWLRSPRSGYANYFVSVNTGGAAHGELSWYSYGVAPLFLV